MILKKLFFISLGILLFFVLIPITKFAYANDCGPTNSTKCNPNNNRELWYCGANTHISRTETCQAGYICVDKGNADICEPEPAPPGGNICTLPNICKRNSCGNGFTGVNGDCSANGPDYVCCQAAAAVNTPPPVPPGGGGGNPNESMIDLDDVLKSVETNNPDFKFGSSPTLGFILGSLLPYLLGFAGFGLLIFLVASGFGYLMSIGDTKKMEAAKNTLTNAVIGFSLIITAYWISGIVNYIFNLGTSIQ